MDINDREYLKEFLVELYGAQAKRWSMNEKVFAVVQRMINESSACSDLMDIVPRPHAIGKAPIKYITKEIRSAVIRKLKERKEHYSSCMRVVGAHYKTQVYMSALGL